MVRDNDTEEGTFQKLSSGVNQNLDPRNLYRYELATEKQVRFVTGGKKFVNLTLT